MDDIPVRRGLCQRRQDLLFYLVGKDGVILDYERVRLDTLGDSLPTTLNG
jgi:hypothetical protein